MYSDAFSLQFRPAFTDLTPDQSSRDE